MTAIFVDIGLYHWTKQKRKLASRGWVDSAEGMVVDQHTREKLTEATRVGVYYSEMAVRGSDRQHPPTGCVE